MLKSRVMGYNICFDIGRLKLCGTPWATVGASPSYFEVRLGGDLLSNLPKPYNIQLSFIGSIRVL
jgi:hypothetical protein